MSSSDLLASGGFSSRLEAGSQKIIGNLKMACT
jgi:hypothetical protein